MFWDAVAEDLAADLLAAAGLGIITVAVAYWRFSGRLARLRHWLHPTPPDHRVLIAATGHLTDVRPKQNDSTPFRSPLSPLERDELVTFYEHINLTVAYDRRVVRLDRLQPEPEISIVDYFDLLATNLTAFSANTRLLSTVASLSAMWRWVRIRPLIGKIMVASKRGGRVPDSVESVLANSHLANVVAVSVLLTDERGRGLFTRRPADPTVVSDQWLATASGTVEAYDAIADDPFATAAARLVRDHAGISDVEMELVGVIMPKRKLQPIFVYRGAIRGLWEEVLTEVSTAKALLVPDAELRMVDLRSPTEVVRFCRIASANETTAYLAWHDSMDIVGAEQLAKAWRHRWLGRLSRPRSAR